MQDHIMMLTGDVARLLNVSPDAVRSWHRAGKLPGHITIRGVRLFHRADVDRLALQRKNVSGSSDRQEAHDDN